MVVRRRTNARFSCAFGRIGVQVPGCTSNRNSSWLGMLASQIGRRARVVKVKSDRLPSCMRLRLLPPVCIGLWREGGPRWGNSSATCAMTWGSLKATLQVQTVGDKWICLRTSARRVSHRPWRNCARRSQARPGGIPGLRDGLWHHAGSAVGRGCRGHYRRCGSGYDAGRGRSACGRYR